MPEKVAALGGKNYGDNYIGEMSKTSPCLLPTSIDATVNLRAEADYLANCSLAAGKGA